MSFISNLFSTISTYPIFNALMVLYHLLGDMGLAIVALTGVIFVVTLPFTMKQLKFTKAVQALQPELAEIKRRHRGDQQAQVKAEQALYRAHGLSVVPPIIPALIQMFAFSGLFFALNFVLSKAKLSTINSIMYPFLVHFSTLPDISLTWFTFLNAAWHLSLGYPDPTHILPLLTGVVTFIQVRMSQPVNLMQTRDAVSQTAQLMQFVMPLIMVGVTIFLAWQIAAGVALSRLVWLVLSAIQNYTMRGWGSLWIMPTVAVHGSGNATVVQNTVARQQGILRTGDTQRRRRSGGSARRRGRKPRKR